jgi:hypothetical protein
MGIGLFFNYNSLPCVSALLVFFAFVLALHLAIMGAVPAAPATAKEPPPAPVTP